MPVGVSLKYHLVPHNIPLWLDYMPSILLYDDGIYRAVFTDSTQKGGPHGCHKS
jgi:hypothetical protein